ncbi:MAG: hypothetical protein QOC59_805 [Microbacteriaceae bacterium]|nr:hypothetical protein [Microbacteriaceae bacterium]
MSPESVAGLFVGGSVLDVLVIRIGLALWPAPPDRAATPLSAATRSADSVELDEAA